MKFTVLAAFLIPAALAAPTEGNAIAKRQTAETDSLLFGMSLPSFSARRAARNPPTLDWSSDNCSWSPDNPFGYPFEPGCQRHDFGYRNYKAQGRFSDANKLRIDDNFKSDLYYQCSGVSTESVCRGLANVYYEAVRAFGRRDASHRVASEASSAEEFAAYEAAVAEYEAEVKKAQEAGLLPVV